MPAQELRKNPEILGDLAIPTAIRPGIVQAMRIHRISGNDLMLQILTVTFVSASPKRWGLAKLTLAAASVTIADIFFYRESVGLSLAVFLAMMAVIAVVTNPVRADPARQRWALGLFVASLLPLLEQCGFLPICFGVLGSAGFAVLMVSDPAVGSADRLRHIIKLPFCGPPWLIGDCLRLWRLVRLLGRATIDPASLLIWILPLSVSAIFLWLFTTANPLIGKTMGNIHLGSLIALLDFRRFYFWLFVLAAIWPLLHLRDLRRASEPVGPIAPTRPANAEFDALIGEKPITVTLVLCNILFAVETVLDAAYLWGGVALPDGMTYATYAHQGAYPLVVTALLAGLFVMVAMRDGGPAAGSKLIRPLVLLWTGQNVLLVASAMLRLQLYVEAFSLTLLRVVAFIWMILVLIGLILIIVQICSEKSRSWLLMANGVSLTVVLYASCFMNFPYLEASYNIAHCREVTGSGPYLDSAYLFNLGPDVLPALEDIPAVFTRDHGAWQLAIHNLRDRAEDERPDNWRSWGFRQWRLDRYLANNPADGV